MVNSLSPHDYRQTNFNYWQSEYETRYPDTNLVKLYHHVLKLELPLGKRVKALDYGCSNGTNAFFLADMGFDAYGVDINKIAIEKAKKKAGEQASHFATISTDISASDVYHGGNFDLILSWHTLYYLSDADLALRLKSLHDQLKPGGTFVATYVSVKTGTYAQTESAADGLRKMPFNERLRTLHGKEHFSNFVRDQAHLEQKFSLFKRTHVGYIDECFSIEGGENLFHYIFVGRKE